MAKMSKEIVFPHVVKSKHGEVKVYRCRNAKKWWTHVVCWRADGRRVKESHAELRVALARAEEVLEDMAQGRIERAETSTGKFLYYRACEEKLGGVPLLDAVDFYLAHHARGKGSLSVEQAVAQFLAAHLRAAAKNPDGSVTDQQARHISTTRQRLTVFAAALKKPMTAVSARDINEYLDAHVGWSGRTRLNHRVSLIALFGWAQKHEILPYGEPTAAQRSDKPKVEQDEPGIFTPEDLRILLEGVDKEFVPYIAIGGLAGVRVCELRRLQWSNIDWEGSTITLRKQDAKGRRRRAALIRPELMTWLQEFKGREGAIAPWVAVGACVSKAAKKLGVAWVQNGMRHSYISYAMAIERNAGRVAEQCGNSENMVQGSYKALVSEKEAIKWFSVEKKGKFVLGFINPGKGDNK